MQSRLGGTGLKFSFMVCPSLTYILTVKVKDNLVKKKLVTYHASLETTPNKSCAHGGLWTSGIFQFQDKDEYKIIYIVSTALTLCNLCIFDRL